MAADGQPLSSVEIDFILSRRPGPRFNENVNAKILGILVSTSQLHGSTGSQSYRSITVIPAGMTRMVQRLFRGSESAWSPPGCC
jgi:hypothetical protein